MRASLLLSLLLVPLCSSCLLSRTDTNEVILPEAVAQLQPGVHTAADVVGVLGGPTEVVQLGRRSAYKYDRRTEKQTGLWLVIFGLRGVDARSDRIWVFFDEDEMLTHVGSTFEAKNAQYELPLLGEDDE